MLREREMLNQFSHLFKPHLRESDPHVLTLHLYKTDTSSSTQLHTHTHTKYLLSLSLYSFLYLCISQLTF